MEILVGATGFVGSNIVSGHKFGGLYNSRNISEAYGTNPDLCVYAGLRAEKYLANNDPEGDLTTVRTAFENIKKIAPKKLVLISTIDVYKEPVNVDENSLIDTENLHPYGLNRYLLEEWVREYMPDSLVVRLPGLYGMNIKKNFIYDMINFLPFMLNQAKYSELSDRESLIAECYVKQDNGFYRLSCAEDKRQELKAAFERAGFSALNFTDSRGVFQFYPLSRLWSDIETAMENKLTLLNPATEPISVGELYRYVTGTDFVNEIADKPPFYNYRSCHADIFGGSDGYIMKKDQLLADIRRFILEQTNKN